MSLCDRPIFDQKERLQSDKGVIRDFAIDPATAAWHQIYEKQLAGGLVLHWQPSPDGTLIQSETAVGNWAHGLTVNDETGRAFVWADEGVHIVSLAKQNLGAYLGVIKTAAPRQRSWFCWTPQGGSHTSNNICLFDIAANRFLGTVAAGKHEGSFFDRDVGFSRDRTITFVTNPADKTLTAIDISHQQVIGQIPLPAKPVWMKVLTA